MPNSFRLKNLDLPLKLMVSCEQIMIALLLSWYMSMGVTLKPSSAYMSAIQLTCLTASCKARSSASVEESATDFCLKHLLMMDALLGHGFKVNPVWPFASQCMLKDAST